MSFAFASCSHWEQGYFTAYEHLAKEELDLTFHLGDGVKQLETRRGHLGADSVAGQGHDPRHRSATYQPFVLLLARCSSRQPCGPA